MIPNGIVSLLIELAEFYVELDGVVPVDLLAALEAEGIDISRFV